MTETEATYKTGERLPECETGSVERMLEAAIEWNQRTRARLVIAVSEPECARAATLMESQTKLLRNILAKVQGSVRASVVARASYTQKCPQCKAEIGVLTQLYNLELKYTPEHTTHG